MLPKMKGFSNHHHSHSKFQRRIRLHQWMVKSVFGLVILVFLASMVVTVMEQFHENTYTITVTDKEVKKSPNSEEEQKYLIFGELPDGTARVFENTDSLLRTKFNSSDVYGQLKVGQTYTIETYGYRVPFFSMYENIVSVELAKEKKK